MKKLQQKEFLLVAGLCLMAFIVRLYGITNPILDWHAFRQADTASVTREYLKNGVNILEPKYHDHSNIQSGIDNLDGYRMVEFPFVNAWIATVLRINGVNEIAFVSRLYSAAISIGTLICLYLLVKKISGRKIAFLSGFFFAFLPFSVFYSRVVLPEPYMLFFSTLSLLTFWKFLEDQKNKNISKNLKWYLISLVSLILAVLLKPFVLVLAPVYISIAWVQQKKSMFKNLGLYFFPIIALVPLALWRDWIKGFPSGIPASDWLLNGNNIRFRPAWFRWIFYERITKLILGVFGAIFLPMNFIKAKQKTSELLIYGSWWLAMIIYVTVIASGNVRHDYYQVLLIPIIAISAGRGTYLLYELLSKKLNNGFAIGFIGISVAATLSFSWKQIAGYYNINHWEYVRAGAKVDELLPEDAKVIAPAMGDTMFLFQTNRTGWPIGFEIEDKIQKGATHYVSVNYDDESRRLEKQFTTIFKNDEFIILNLTKPLETIETES